MISSSSTASYSQILDDEVLLKKTPVVAISSSTRSLLSQLLNPDQVIPTESGVSRDARGLAEAFSFSYTQVRNFERESDPTKAIFESLPKDTTVDTVVKGIEAITRFDVLDDVAPFIARDLKAWSEKRPLLSLDLEDEQTGVPSTTKYSYDAYICYADEDREFVMELTSFLESRDLKMFVRERDFLAGSLEYETFMHLLERRCRRMLVILSPAFLESKECENQTRFATSLAVEMRSRIIIPLLVAKCPVLPSSLSILSKIDFCRVLSQEASTSSVSDRFSKQSMQWTLNKLIMSITGNEISEGGVMNRNQVPTSLPFNNEKKQREVQNNKVKELPSPDSQSTTPTTPPPSSPSSSKSHVKWIKTFRSKFLPSSSPSVSSHHLLQPKEENS